MREGDERNSEGEGGGTERIETRMVVGQGGREGRWLRDRRTEGDEGSKARDGGWDGVDG